MGVVETLSERDIKRLADTATNLMPYVREAVGIEGSRYTGELVLRHRMPTVTFKPGNRELVMEVFDENVGSEPKLVSTSNLTLTEMEKRLGINDELLDFGGVSEKAAAADIVLDAALRTGIDNLLVNYPGLMGRVSMIGEPSTKDDLRQSQLVIDRRNINLSRIGLTRRAFEDKTIESSKGLAMSATRMESQILSDSQLLDELNRLAHRVRSVVVDLANEETSETIDAKTVPLYVFANTPEARRSAVRAFIHRSYDQGDGNEEKGVVELHPRTIANRMVRQASDFSEEVETGYYIDVVNRGERHTIGTKNNPTGYRALGEAGVDILVEYTGIFPPLSLRARLGEEKWFDVLRPQVIDKLSRLNLRDNLVTEMGNYYRTHKNDWINVREGVSIGRPEENLRQAVGYYESVMAGEIEGKDLDQMKEMAQIVDLDPETVSGVMRYAGVIAAQANSLEHGDRCVDELGQVMMARITDEGDVQVVNQMIDLMKLATGKAIQITRPELIDKQEKGIAIEFMDILTRAKAMLSKPEMLSKLDEVAAAMRERISGVWERNGLELGHKDTIAVVFKNDPNAKFASLISESSDRFAAVPQAHAFGFNTGQFIAHPDSILNLIQRQLEQSGIPVDQDLGDEELTERLIMGAAAMSSILVNAQLAETPETLKAAQSDPEAARQIINKYLEGLV